MIYGKWLINKISKAYVEWKDLEKVLEDAGGVDKE
jgi:hypothetical protein